MALTLNDRVKQVSTTTGTGTITLGITPSGFQSFTDGLSDGDTTYYSIVNTESGVTEWEVGLGTYTASGTTLARTTVYTSSNSGSLVNFGAGDKDEDVKRYAYFEKNPEKYPLVSVVKIPLQAEGISGTTTRDLISSDIDEALEYFVPPEVSETDKDAIKSILTA